MKKARPSFDGMPSVFLHWRPIGDNSGVSELFCKGESATDLAGRLEELLWPWTGGLPVEVLRSASYVFSARLADRWQAGRVFLLGDAAH